MAAKQPTGESQPSSGPGAGAGGEQQRSAFLAVVKYLKQARDSLGKRPPSDDVNAASAAVATICTDLEKQVESLASGKGSAEVGLLVQGAQAAQGLKAFKESVARSKAQMELLPHVSVLELDKKFRHYDALVALAEQALLSGSWHTPEGQAEFARALALSGDAASASAGLPSPLLSLNLPQVFGPSAPAAPVTNIQLAPTAAKAVAGAGAGAAVGVGAVSAVAAQQRQRSIPRSATGAGNSIMKPSAVAAPRDDSHTSLTGTLSSGAGYTSRGPSFSPIIASRGPKASNSGNFPLGSNNLVAITERESRLGKPGQPPANGEGIEEDGTSIIINSVLLKIIQDSVQSRPSTLDIRGHLFDAPLEYIPETLGFVDSLTELYLADNQLLVLPDSLGSLKRLTVLDASCNQLMELPRSIGELTELKELDLHHNKLEELPVTLGQCVALERVSLEFNQLKALPQSIGQLKSLKTLKLHLNQISVLPFTMGQLSNLVDLDVHHNSLKSIPESIGRLQKLEKLNISANHFSLQVELHETEKLNIITANRDDVQLVGLQLLPSSMGSLANLKELDLRENHIKVLPATFTQLTNLKSLKLDGNPWRFPPLEVADKGMEAVMEYLASSSSESRSVRGGALGAPGAGGGGGGLLGGLFRRGKKSAEADKLEQWKSHANTWGA